MERDDLVWALKDKFDADCEFSVLLPSGQVLPIIGLIYGPNVSEDAIFVTSGADMEYMGTGAIVLMTEGNQKRLEKIDGGFL